MRRRVRDATREEPCRPAAHPGPLTRPSGVWRSSVECRRPHVPAAGPPMVARGRLRPAEVTVAGQGAMRNDEFELRGVNHIALVCSDMARTVEFYTQVLGMPLVK